MILLKLCLLASIKLAPTSTTVDDTSLRQLKSTLITSQRRIEQLELEKVELTEAHRKALDAVTIEGRLVIISLIMAFK